RQDIDLMDNEGHLDGGPANFDFLLKDFSGTSNIWGGSLPDREPSDEELGLAHCSLTVWRSQLFGQKLYRNTDPVISKESKWELTKLLRPVPWLGYKYQLNRVSEGDINYNSPQEVILHCWKADTYSGDSPNPAGNPTNAELVRLLYGIFKFTGK
ncbi:MAG: hypothetical protein KDD43_10800, partial [Bdellovibrionales bacterium]|nr:hypothetical protein [Bdellovibrionales bacterium]